MVEKQTKKMPACEGYIVVDPQKCCGCQTCMMICSLVNCGRINTKLARIQVLQDPFGCYPDDLDVALCRQCVNPACLKACPMPGAIFIDTENGNVRRIDSVKCDGCMVCVDACPFVPGRIIWNFEKGVAEKCDLCAEAPYWKEKGGVYGKQACMEICPMGAIDITSKIPLQRGDSGYKINLRGEGWPLDRG